MEIDLSTQLAKEEEHGQNTYPPSALRPAPRRYYGRKRKRRNTRGVFVHPFTALCGAAALAFFALAPGRTVDLAAAAPDQNALPTAPAGKITPQQSNAAPNNSTK